MCCPERDSSPILSISLPTYPAISLGHMHSSGAFSWSSIKDPGTVGDVLPWKRLLSYFEYFPAHLSLPTFPAISLDTCTAVALVLDPRIKDPGTVGDVLPWKRLLSYFEYFPAHLPCNKPRKCAQQWRLFLILGSRTLVLFGMRCPERESSPILSVSLPPFPAKSLGYVHSSGACSWSLDQGPRYCWGCVVLKETPLPFWVIPCPPFPEERIS